MTPLVKTLCPEFDARTGCNQPKEPGAVVQIGNNRGPRYRIVAIDSGEAWVRPLGYGQPGVAPLDALRVVTD